MTKQYIPDLYIEQFVLDELPDDRMNRVLSTPGLKERTDELKHSDEEILSAYPPEIMVARINERLNAVPRAENKPAPGFTKNGQRWIPLLAAAAVLAVVFTFAPGRLGKSGADTGPAAELTRIKGSAPTLHIYRQLKKGSEELTDGAEASRRDVLQLGYSPAGVRYGAIISIDGRGHVTLHYPEHINDSIELQSGGKILLPFAFELDDAPRFERFYFVSSNEEFSLAEVIISAESVAASSEALTMEQLPLPESFEQDSLVLMKE